MKGGNLCFFFFFLGEDDGRNLHLLYQSNIDFEKVKEGTCTCFIKRILILKYFLLKSYKPSLIFDSLLSIVLENPNNSLNTFA